MNPDLSRVFDSMHHCRDLKIDRRTLIQYIKDSNKVYIQVWQFKVIKDDLNQ